MTANGGLYRGMTLYSFVDNHDVNRIYSKLNVKGHLKPVHALLYFLPGIPSIYYGSEFGIEGRSDQGGDDALRPAVDLRQMKENNPHPQLTEWIKTLGGIRKAHLDACAGGAYRELLLTNRQYAFARIGEKETLVVAVNNDEGAAAPVSFPVPGDGAYVDAVTGRNRGGGGRKAFPGTGALRLQDPDPQPGVILQDPRPLRRLREKTRRGIRKYRKKKEKKPWQGRKRKKRRVLENWMRICSARQPITRSMRKWERIWM